ncbi:MAG: hypothetical protein C0497_09715 [Gemmatimonas sp.]|nr:hypothetical protein [Gemmatimonas sp.]
MSLLRLRGFGGAAAAMLLAIATSASAQVTTGAVGGVVRDGTGRPVDGAQVQVLNKSTGYRLGGLTRETGRYQVSQLAIGDNYSVTVRRIGFAPQTRDGVNVTLGQTTTLDFTLTSQATQLSSVTVVADPTNQFTASRKGVETSVTDSLIRRLPTFNRDIAAFTKYTPQVMYTEGNGPSAGGAYNRYNTFTIDGANQSDKFNLASSNGVPGGNSNARIISMEAVKEFQVLTTPADVRQGNFVGMGVNMVTKSGTNDLKGGLTYAWRNPQLGANQPFIRNSGLLVQQYGFYVGGPIIKDKLHFFIAPELQERANPASGQFAGASATTVSGLVSADSIARIQRAIAARGKEIGGGERVSIDNPLQNITARLDYRLNDRHRLVFRQLNNTAENVSFSRNNSNFNSALGVQNSGYRLTSNMYRVKNKNTSSTLQLFSSFDKGWTNEFSAGYNTISDIRAVSVEMPEISLPVTRSNGSGQVAVTFGTEQFSPNNTLRQRVLEVTDNLTIPIGEHTITAGARFERTYIYNLFAQKNFGVYKFNSITDLEAGRALNYELSFDNGGGIPAAFYAHQYTAYLQDQWDVTDRFSVTAGLRLDAPQFLDTPPQNDTIVARLALKGLPAINTSDKPKFQVLFSPRVGFNWDPTGDRKNQVRGTLGIFTAPPPFILVANGYQNSGKQLVVLQCSGSATPAFSVELSQLPRSCAGQPAPAPGQAGTAGINVTDPNFKYPQYGVGSFGFDRALPWKMTFTFDAVYRRAINGLMIYDKNIIGPRMVGGVPYTDRNGRILYADTISATGSVTNDNQRAILRLGSPAVTFGEGIIYLSNQSKDYNYTLTGQIKKKFDIGIDATVAYTYNQSKDVQSLTSDRAISNWRFGRTITGLESDATLGTSAFERPHRVLFFGTWNLPWKSTDINWYYEGTSGFPMVYTAQGDLNGDGFNGNDPIYVPKNANDPNEITFNNVTGGPTAAQQADLFEKFISANTCLDSQRGRIMKRNSCNSPWQNRLDVSVRQNLGKSGLASALHAPALSNFVVQLDIFNFANFLNKKWGQLWWPTLSSSFPQQQVLIQRGRTAGPLNQSQPIFEFASQVRANTESTARNAGAFYARQTSTLNFYQMQLTVRYSF